MSNRNNNATSDARKKIKAKPGENIIEILRRTNPKLFNMIADEQYEIMERFNKRIAQVKIGGKVRYADREDKYPVFYSAADMALILAHETVMTWEQERRPAFSWWQRQDDRAQYHRVVFEPNVKRVAAGEFNLFRGFPVAPKAKPGGWAKFKDHLKNNVCDGNAAHYAYLKKWMAHLFKKPGQKIGVALILQGLMGTGKSKVGEVLASGLGERYCPIADSPESLTGKHNRHLAEAILIRAEEALNPRDPRHESRLRHLITGGTFMIEPKGVDAFEVESKANLIFTTNNPHVVPALGGERRFFCLHVANHRMQDREYFRQIDEEMANGGMAAFIYDMLQVDLTGFDLSSAPKTQLLADQITASMGGLERWWLDVLSGGRIPWKGEASGHLPLNPDRDDPDARQRAIAMLEWPEAETLTSPCAVVAASAADHVRGYAGPPSPEAVGRFLATVAPGIVRDRVQEDGVRYRAYVFPPLEVLREAFVAARPGLTFVDVGGTPPKRDQAEVSTNEEGHSKAA